MNEVIFGFMGVLVGACIPWIREEFNERRLRKRYGMYLAARVVCVLDEYVEKCVDVVGDDGTIMGQAAFRHENGEEHYYPQVTLPEPPDYPADVDWKSINGDLMYRLLALPNNALNTDRGIQTAEYFASPPDYENFFEARYTGYATLGLQALQLAKELRRTYRIPPKNYGKWNPDWNPEKHLQDVKRKIEERYKNRDIPFANNHSDLQDRVEA